MKAEKISGGANKPLRYGQWFIKPAADNGSPHAEEAASHALDVLGVPHHPVSAIRYGQGMASKSRFLPNLKSLGETTREDLHKHRSTFVNPDRIGNVLLGDWLTGVGDRHAGNYAWTPEHGLFSLDHGDAFHYGNFLYPSVRAGIIDPTDPHSGWGLMGSMGTDPKRWAHDPAVSALTHFTTTHAGVSYPNFLNLSLPQDTLDKALAARNALEHFAYQGTEGLPEDERQLAVKAMQTRLDALAGMRPHTVMDLRKATEAVRDAARRYTR